MLSRTIVHRRNRRKVPQNAGSPGATITPVCSIVATKLRITCSLPVVVSALPVSITVQAQPPTSFTIISPTVFDLGYAASVVATNVAIIPGNVPQVRSSTGGFLSALTVTL